MNKQLKKNIETLKHKFGNSDELIIKELKIGNTQGAIAYLVGLTDTEALSEFVISPLQKVNTFSSIENLMNKHIPLSELSTEENEIKVVGEIIKGKGALLLDKYREVIILSIDKFKERSIMEPPTSSVLKGPRAGFVESLKTNLTVIRQILSTPKLRTVNLKVGRLTQTQVTITYLDGIADTEVVKTIEKRIKEIDIDGIVDSNYIASFLEERKNSMFKQIGSTEKPDVLSAKLLEGRVGIIVDGSPMVLTLPFIYLEEIQSGDDYYSNHSRATFIRWVRIMSIFITILTPALYIAVVLHHYKAIPLKFLITIINTTKGLPLTPFAEILFVLLLFEILYEASVRMPKYLGLALSIVGALILGDTAVKAGLISPPAVMIVAISGLTIYCIPDQAPQLYTLRMLFTLAGGMLGFFGITVLLIFVIAYLCDFDSYGTPYLAPLAPFVEKDIKDAFYKTDLTNNFTRPVTIKNNKKNNKRMNIKNDKKNIH